MPLKQRHATMLWLIPFFTSGGKILLEKLIQVTFHVLMVDPFLHIRRKNTFTETNTDDIPRSYGWCLSSHTAEKYSYRNYYRWHATLLWLMPFFTSGGKILLEKLIQVTCHVIVVDDGFHHIRRKNALTETNTGDIQRSCGWCISSDLVKNYSYRNVYRLHATVISRELP